MPSTTARAGPRAIVCEEVVDPRKVLYIVQRFDSLPVAFQRGKTKVEQEVFMEKYSQKLQRGGVVRTTYRQTKGSNGRMFGQPCFQGMEREIRHTLARDNYFDVDIANAHPVLLEHYCGQHQIACPQLSDYNKHRQRYIDVCMNSFKYTKGEAKMLFLKVINGGGNRMRESANRDLHNFHVELVAIRAAIMAREPKMKKAATDKATNKAGANAAAGAPYNISGSCINILLCEMENQCLMAMYDLLVSLKIEVGALVFDGLMIRKSTSYCLQEILPRLEAHVRTTTGFQVTIVEKAMDEGFEIPEDQLAAVTLSQHLRFEDQLPNEFPFELSSPVDAHVHHLALHAGSGIVDVFIERTHHSIKFDEQSASYYVWNCRTLLWEKKRQAYIATLVRHVLWVYADNDGDDVVKKIITTPSRVNQLLSHLAEGFAQRADGFASRLNSHTDRVSVRDGCVVDLPSCTIRKRVREDWFSFETKVTLLPEAHEVLQAAKWIIELCKEKVHIDRPQEALVEHSANLEHDEEGDQAGEDAKSMELGECEYRRNTEKEELLLNWLGYSQTGDIHMRQTAVIVGPQGCGKTILGDEIGEVRGPDRAVKGPASVIMGHSKTDPDAHTASKNRMEGRHLFIMSEPMKGMPLKCDALNEFVGERELAIRNLHSECRQIVNTCKLMLLCNWIPIIPPERKNDMADKLLIITLEHIFDVHNKENIEFVTRTMKTQDFHDQVFTLCARRAKMYYDNGRTFRVPRNFDAIEKYTKTSFYTFCVDCLLLDPLPKTNDSNQIKKTRKSHFIASHELQQAYTWYCTKVQKFKEVDILNAHTFGTKMREKVEGLSSDAVRATDGKKVKVRFGVQWRLSFFKDTECEDRCQVQSLAQELHNLEAMDVSN